MTTSQDHNFKRKWNLSRFSFVDTDDSHENKEREGIISIHLYHFYLITKIQEFICSFAFKVTTFFY